MILETKKAAREAARGEKNKNIRIELQLKPYQKDILLSSLKTEIGEILLLLLTGNEQPDGWRRFDRLLRQYYTVRCR